MLSQRAVHDPAARGSQTDCVGAADGMANSLDKPCAGFGVKRPTMDLVDTDELLRVSMLCEPYESGSLVGGT